MNRLILPFLVFWVENREINSCLVVFLQLPRARSQFLSYLAVETRKNSFLILLLHKRQYITSRISGVIVKHFSIPNHNRGSKFFIYNNYYKGCNFLESSFGKMPSNWCNLRDGNFRVFVGCRSSDNWEQTIDARKKVEIPGWDIANRHWLRTFTKFKSRSAKV